MSHADYPLPMPSAGSIATAALGLGFTIASTFAGSLGLSVHQQRIGFAVGVVLIVLGGVLYLRRGGSKGPVEPEPSVSSAGGRNSYAAGRDLFVNQGSPAGQQAGVTGLRPGDLARRAMATSTSKDKDPLPLHRAIANGISELEDVRSQLLLAGETGHLQTKTPERWRKPLGDALTDQGWHESRKKLDAAYRGAREFWTRLHAPGRGFDAFGDIVTPTIEESDELPVVVEGVDRALADLHARQGSSGVQIETARIGFDRVEVGESRTFREENVFHESWSGVPVVFDIVNPQGGPRARAVRPTVTVKDQAGAVLAGPVNARWSNPQPPRAEEMERDIPANGAPVGIDTLVQEVGGDRFWLVTDEALRAGLKSTGSAIPETDVLVTLSIQGENLPMISETVRVRLGFPGPAIGEEAPDDTILAPQAREPEEDSTPALAISTRASESEEEVVEPESAEAPSRPRVPRSFGLKGELEAERDEGYKLLSALKGGLVASWRYDRVPTADDVKSWSANVEHLLRGDTKMVLLFRWRPLELSATTSVRELVASALGSSAATVELERLLTQLEKVIEGL
jgi:hypothetical protein